MVFANRKLLTAEKDQKTISCADFLFDPPSFPFNGLRANPLFGIPTLPLISKRYPSHISYPITYCGTVAVFATQSPSSSCSMSASLLRAAVSAQPLGGRLRSLRRGAGCWWWCCCRS